MPNFNLSFSIITRDLLELQVTAQNSNQAVDRATEQILENLSSNQALYLRDVTEVPDTNQTAPTVSSGYVSLSSLLANSNSTTPEPTASSLPDIPGYNRLVN